MPSVLLQTKLRCPSLPPKRVRRPQLIARLAEGFESGRHIALVSAPAGFGKTTCVAEWLQGVSQPVSWLSLDPSDNDPARFFYYFIAALQKADPNVGKEIGLALHSGQLPPVETISAGLVNDLLQVASPFLLVLDDLHVIQNSTVLDVLEKLATNLPPCLFLILLTREDPSLPLARLRANNQVAEIRAADLRFTLGEANAFLNEVMGLDLSSEDTASLSDRTEGWVVGLQLAALSLKNRENRGEFIARLSGSQHFILSYLTEEVLRRLPPEIQEFLLDTSLLDRLGGPLCNAVTERADSAAVLEQLYTSNVFVIPLDEDHTWYRYHHLFADLLRNQLSRTRPEREPLIHRRASAWFEAQNNPIEAVNHALAAKDHLRVVPLLDRYARWMLSQGYVVTLEHWLRQLPPEWRVAGPQANLAIAGSLLLRGRLAEVEPFLRNAEAAAEERSRSGALAEADKILCEARLSRAIYDSIRGEIKSAISLAQEAVGLAPRDDPYLQGMALFALGGAYHYDAQIVPAIDAYLRARPLCQTSGNNIASMLIIANLGLLFMLQGKLRAAADLCIQTIQAAEQAGGAHSPALASVYTNYSAILYEWGDFSALHHLTDRSLEVSKRSGHVSALAHDRLVLARLCWAEGDMAGAQAKLDESEKMLGGAPDWVTYRTVAFRVALALAREDEAAAVQALAKIGLAVDNPIDERREPIHIAHLRLLHYRGLDDREGAHLDQALELAQRLLASAEPNGRMGRVIEILALRALVYQARGDLALALEDICRAFELAEPEGYLRLFVDEGEPMARLLRTAQARCIQPAYVAKLLAAFPSEASTASTPQSGLVEPLTDRELEVLRLIAEGLSYREIADRLVVSVNTVRFHVKGIYGKLGVENRAAAIAQARTLKLLP